MAHTVIIRMIHIIASVISYDIWFYISHVLLHSKYLYKYHKEHHYKIVPQFLDTYAGHRLEGPFQGVGMFFPFAVLTYTYYDILLILFLLNLRGMMRHDERCVFLIGNHHLLHHRYPNYNYGEYWIDWLFGTLLHGSKTAALN
jgi:lathosterol oxidase